MIKRAAASIFIIQKNVFAPMLSEGFNGFMSAAIGYCQAAPGSLAGNLIEVDTGSGALQYTLGAGNSHCFHPELISGVTDPVPQGPGSGRIFYQTQVCNLPAQVRAGGTENPAGLKGPSGNGMRTTGLFPKRNDPIRPCCFVFHLFYQRPQTSRVCANRANRANGYGQ